MALQITVISPSARQVIIKTRPESYLNDIHEDACGRLRLDPSQYGLKHNNRELDLSNAMRQAGLSPGARLQLTLLSKSPSVINVALQLADSRINGHTGQRMTDKFSSTTSLWMVLRKFEAGVAGQAGTTNLTGRGVPKGGEGKTGSGRLYYETPVISNQGRSWRSFTDLQKTLAQLGFTKGSVLFRLTFETTGQPLEEAMGEIDQYFRATEEQTEPIVNSTMSTATEHQPPEALTKPESSPGPESGQEPAQSAVNAQPRVTVEVALAPEPIPGVTSRPATVFSPPSSDTPQAARIDHNPQDFVPTVEHAKAHQTLLSRESVNKRLLSDAELAAQEKGRVEKLAATSKVDIKLRFPDQSSVVAAFSRHDTAKDLFEFTRNLLAKPDEPFGLQYAHGTGNKLLPRGDQKLITDIGMTTRVLVIVVWEEGTSLEARKGKSLKAEVAAQGKEIQVQPTPPVDDDEPGHKVAKSLNDESTEKPKGKGVPKWLKLPGKK